MRRLLLPFLVLATVTVKIHLPTVIDPNRFDGDARQHVFWTYRFQDPGLFPGDPLVEFISSPRFDPVGYQALYAVGARAVDPLLFSKLLGVALSLVCGLLVYRIGARYGGVAGGAAAILATGFLLFDTNRVALPRSFAVPAVLLALTAVVERRPWLGGLSLIAAALFYPPAVLSAGALLPLLLPPAGHRSLREVARLLVPVGAPALVALAIVIQGSLLVDREATGSMVTREQSLEMAEFGEGGRNHFWRDDPVAFYLGDWGYNRSACGLLSKAVAIPAVGVLILLAALRRRAILPGPLVWLLASSAILFAIAHAVLFRLYLPSRFTIFTWPLGLGLLFAVNLVRVGAPLASGRESRLQRLATAVFALALAAVAAIAATKPLRSLEARWEGLYREVARLPESSLLAGHPVHMDDIPLRTRRSVLINRELSLAWYQGYYGRIRPRIEANLEILFGPDRERSRSLAQKFGVTHLVIDRRQLDLSPGELASSVDRPFDAILAGLLGDRVDPWWADGGLAVVWERDGLALVALGD